MKSKPTPTSFHRRLISEAWSLVWQRRSLWVFGLFGGLVLSGTIVEPAFSGLMRVVRLGTFWLQARAEAWAEATLPVGSTIQHICRLSPLAVQIGLSAFVVLAFFFVLFAFLCQGGLIVGLSERKPISAPDTLRHGWTHAWSVFMLGLLARAYQLVLLLLISLPILFYVEGFGIGSTFGACLAILLYLPLAIGGHAVNVFASIHAVRHQTTVPEALEVGVRLVFARWLEVFETGVILLALNGLSVMAFCAFLVVFFIPIVLLFAAIQSGGWFIGMGLTGAVGLLAFCVALLMFIGLLSAFRMAVWIKFYDRVRHPLHGPRTIAKLKRLFHPAHIR